MRRLRRARGVRHRLWYGALDWCGTDLVLDCLPIPVVLFFGAQSATPVLMISLRLTRAGAVLSILSSFVLPTNRSSTSHTSPDTTHRLRLAEVTPHIMQLVRQGRSERGEMGSASRIQGRSRATCR